MSKKIRVEKDKIFLFFKKKGRCLWDLGKNRKTSKQSQILRGKGDKDFGPREPLHGATTKTNQETCEFPKKNSRNMCNLASIGEERKQAQQVPFMFLPLFFLFFFRKKIGLFGFSRSSIGIAKNDKHIKVSTKKY